MAIMFTSQQAYLICLAHRKRFCCRSVFPAPPDATPFFCRPASHGSGLTPFRPEYTLHTQFLTGGGRRYLCLPSGWRVFWIISLNYMGIFWRSDACQADLSLLLSRRTQVAKIMASGPLLRTLQTLASKCALFQQ